ncbi:hypothetical protein M378DRAFT_197390 [Amanita muscaria Koide BX008]|uniref:Uncharacterized protein n=1 Tax=Amanita muscaria (strain Koide BX008) TaxID=946122 RepID=A0A0C2XB39_AMAMK|nr:hypothetical protein M378DRAFT_197390 [Amanita muscaria Koide BX008]
MFPFPSISQRTRLSLSSSSFTHCPVVELRSRSSFQELAYSKLHDFRVLCQLFVTATSVAFSAKAQECKTSHVFSIWCMLPIILWIVSKGLRRRNTTNELNRANCTPYSGEHSCVKALARPKAKIRTERTIRFEAVKHLINTLEDDTKDPADMLSPCRFCHDIALVLDRHEFSSLNYCYTSVPIRTQDYGGNE